LSAMTRRRRLLSFSIALAAAALSAGALTVAPLAATSASAAPGDAQTVNVMAPLWITDWATDGPQWRSFLGQLSTAKRQGVDAVAADVWWGKAEPTRDGYDWAYYDKLFAAIRGAGLDIVPVMSFHQCGGNVGDDSVCKDMPIPVPSWVWDPIEICGIAGPCTSTPVEDYYVSEYGNVDREAPSPWGAGADRTLHDMHDFMDAFEQHYGSGTTDFAADIQEITVSAGPSGELRYPSYNAHDSMVAGSPAGYPGRGTFQSYSPAAIRDFADWAVARYGSVAGVSRAWSIPGLTYAAISPPTDHDRFITSGSYRSIAYGRDFTRWYNESLMEHGREVMTQAIEAFDGALADVPLGIKIPGVHWQTMSSSPMPRAPEVAAGLIHTDQSFDSASTSHGYDTVAQLVRDLDAAGRGHEIVLHFTALEKATLEWDGPYHAYSDAPALVGWVADAAAKAGIVLKGENALAGSLGDVGGPTSNGWSHLRDAFSRTGGRYVGLTVLRIGEVTSGGTGQSEFERFLRDFG
jgi:beta-amylase